MSEPQDLVDQLRRSNRRWKTLALAMCIVLVLTALAGFVSMSRDQLRAERLMSDMAHARAQAQQAAISGQAR